VRNDGDLPLNVTSQGIDVQPRGTGRTSMDLVIATCAIFMSVLSLLIAYNQARMMRQQVAATSWPLLQFGSGNTESGKPLIAMSVQNAGVGPAIVKHFDLYYRGRAYSNVFNLLADCCEYRVTSIDPTRVGPGAPLTSPVEGTIIRPGESTTFFQMPLADENRAPWLLLDKARFELKFDACYCSVPGECWRSDLVGVDPKPVENCPAPRGHRG
jgi:hypothetical protein